jgi:hypothetical protein
VTSVPSQFGLTLRRRVSLAANRFITVTAAAAARTIEEDENPVYVWFAHVYSQE